MSTKKRPLQSLQSLQSLSNAPQTPASRYAPSTPHAIRALQQRSGAGAGTGQRSTRINKTRTDTLLRPDSARGILRRLAKITAPVTKKRRVSGTPVDGKENVEVSSTTGGKKRIGLVDGRGGEDEDGDGDDDGDQVGKRPEFTLPITVNEYQHGWEDEEVSEDLGEAPTPSVLLGDNYEPTVTFQSIAAVDEVRQSMSERPRSRVSRISSISKDGGNESEEEEEEEDDDVEVEIGRRAVSEGPMDRYPRSSFGSIRMSDFGLENQGRGSYNVEERGKMGFGVDDNHDIGVGFGEDHELDLDNETQDFRRHRRSPSTLNELPFNGQDNPDGDVTFRLELPLEAEAHESHARIALSDKVIDNGRQDVRDDDIEQDKDSVSSGPDSPQDKTRSLTPLEAVTARRTRRKKVKLTRHGIEIPALPSSLIKRVAIESMTRRGKRKPKIDRASLRALEQATEWFFEQVGEDLEAYSNHAGRTKRIDTSDVLTLMRRQRVLMGDGKLGDFAIEHLPTEALLELDLPDTL